VSKAIEFDRARGWASSNDFKGRTWARW